MSESATRAGESAELESSEADICAPIPTRIGSFRWRICALLFIANTINYMDRQVLSYLAPLLQTKIGWNDAQYGYIVVAFQFAYAIGLLSVGGIIDKIGVKLGYALSIGMWSLASMSHALARSALAFGTSRFFLGIGESGNFPAAIKTVAEWFPKKERAFATGIFNSGTSVGAILVPLSVPWIVDHLGWQFAFLFTGIFSFLWLIAWLAIYKNPEHDARVNAAELAHIRSDAGEASPTPIPWLRLLGYRQCWAIVIGKFLTDPVWWFLLFWLPKYFASNFHLKLEGLAGPIMVIYIAACIGSVFGGWLPAFWLRMGLSIRSARRNAMLLYALAVLPIVFVGTMHGLWTVVAIISLACAAHQAWSANIFSLVSDIFPRRAVASVTGMAGCGGAIAGGFANGAVGLVVQYFHTYMGIFVACGLAYLTAWLIIQLLTRKPELNFSA
jgi:MFS transporter, ACS family, hexuronate transporter